MPRVVAVASDELLAKIDRTLERNTEAFDRNAAAFDRNGEAFDRCIAVLDRVDARLDRFEQRDAEHTAFLNELTERHARVTEDMIAAIQRFGTELQREIADQRAQIQANTQAVLRLLDRWGPEAS
jgi:predicted  nucleic acid-binding Zn-ribbon protein